MITCGHFFETVVEDGRSSTGSLSRSGRVSSIELPLKLLFRIGPSYVPSRSPRPRRALYNHEQLHRSNPLVSQPPRLEMSNPPVHLPLDRPCTSQRRGARTEFDQKRRRRSPVSNSDAFNEEVWTTLERVLLDHPKMKRTQEDGRCLISASVISREITNEKKKNGERHVLGVVPDTG